MSNLDDVGNLGRETKNSFHSKLPYQKLYKLLIVIIVINRLFHCRIYIIDINLCKSVQLYETTPHPIYVCLRVNVCKPKSVAKMKYINPPTVNMNA